MHENLIKPSRKRLIEEDVDENELEYSQPTYLMSHRTLTGKRLAQPEHIMTSNNEVELRKLKDIPIPLGITDNFVKKQTVFPTGSYDISQNSQLWK